MGWFERGQVVGRLEQTDIEQQAAINAINARLDAMQPAITWANEQLARRSRVHSWASGIVAGIRSRIAIAIYTSAAAYLVTKAAEHVHLRLPW